MEGPEEGRELHCGAGVRRVIDRDGEGRVMGVKVYVVWSRQGRCDQGENAKQGGWNWPMK